ncbi:hypothetical protein [Cedecea sp. P7760]|uniref:hypothetical protein n=1 Tax=Cedecea sp. P7760 TaxID=2726983 RepID=UPI0015A483DF|nr:hypothetical protein [Cedecea sp. P7760]NWC65428.1 hypothetical protein [Cedecea sp. P7760]
MIGYSSVIQSLDSGRYDRNTYTGLRMLACIQDAKAAGWLALSVDKEIIIWRWLVVTVFINEELEKNGTVDVPNDEGGIDTAVIYSGKNGAISIYPAPERFALANHVEGCAVEKYGVDIGQQLALRMYQDMVTADPKQGFRLSAMGREGFEILHDSFIEEINTNGMPDMPVMH